MSDVVEAAISQLIRVKLLLEELSGRLYGKGIIDEAELLLGCTIILHEVIEKLEEKKKPSY